MAKSKYPGFQILYEIGTRSELAQSYGVSERTMYRWLNKAKAETAPKRQSYPGAKAIQQFRGTRKELAQNFGISERTAYRWLNKARAEGANIPSRQMPSRYPGMGILEEEGSNVALGRKYGVSEATIRRWKKQAAAGLPEEIPTEEPIHEEQPAYEEPQPQEEPGYEEPGQEEYTSEDFDKETNQVLFDLLEGYEAIASDSKFRTFDHAKQLELLQSYVMYQRERDPDKFYNKEIHDFDYSPEFVSTINMWGDEFETWLSRMEDLEDFANSEGPWFDYLDNYR